jgi:uncharacterized tellurite resistance protein B-like protein
MTEDQTITRFVAALLVSIANSDGEISAIETEKMLQLVGDHFELKSAESLELLTNAMEDMAENPDLADILTELSTILTSADKEDVAVMMYKVVAADGREGAAERGLGDNRHHTGIIAKGACPLLRRRLRKSSAATLRNSNQFLS